MEEKTRFMTAEDVAKYIGISKPTAYKLIRKMNAELVAAGYYTIAGKISRTYFEKKIYSGITG